MKTLTLANWLEPDPVSVTAAGVIDENGQTRLLDQSDYVQGILKIQLLPAVPDDVKGLFEVAKGAMIYGWLYYPLYTLGADHCCRVIEAAITHRFLIAGGERHKVRRKKVVEVSFAEKLEWLQGKGIIPPGRASMWDTWRELRNLVSHRDRQSIYHTAMAFQILDRCVEDVNSLFG